VHRPYLKLSVPENEQANEDKPADPTRYGIIATEHRPEEGSAERIEPLRERVHKVGVRPGAGVRYAISGDHHHCRQREERRDEPQRAHGEVVADKPQHYASGREY
jgi:hypothetical protein